VLKSGPECLWSRGFAAGSGFGRHQYSRPLAKLLSFWSVDKIISGDNTACSISPLLLLFETFSKLLLSFSLFLAFKTGKEEFTAQGFKSEFAMKSSPG
jgi:hypothetical protein